MVLHQTVIMCTSDIEVCIICMSSSEKMNVCKLNTSFGSMTTARSELVSMHSTESGPHSSELIKCKFRPVLCGACICNNRRRCARTMSNQAWSITAIMVMATKLTMDYGVTLDIDIPGIGCVYDSFEMIPGNFITFNMIVSRSLFESTFTT